METNNGKNHDGTRIETNVDISKLMEACMASRIHCSCVNTSLERNDIQMLKTLLTPETNQCEPGVVNPLGEMRASNE